jgi:signal transduction histidine kinase
LDRWAALLLPGTTIAAAALGALLVLLVRAAPSRGRNEELAHLRLLAVAGGLFSALDAITFLRLPDAVALANARVQIPLAALALWGLFRYTETLEGPGPARLAVALRAVALVGVALYELPGVGLTGRVVRQALPAFGVLSALPEQGPLGQLGVALLSAPGAVVTWRFLQAALAGRPGARRHFVATGLLAATGAVDAATSAGLLAAPLLIPIGFGGCLLLLAGGLAHRFRADAAELDRLRSDLRLQVEERGRVLAEARERLSRTEKLAVVGRLSGGLAHEINNPIAVLTANVEYLIAGLARGQLPADTSQSLGDAQVAAKRVGEAIRQLVWMSRAAVAEADGESYPLEPLVLSAAREAERRLGREGWLDRRIPDGLAVAGRGQLIEKLLLELLLAGGATASRESALLVEAVQQGEEILLAVSREGAWLPADEAFTDGIFVASGAAAAMPPLLLALNLLRASGVPIRLSRGGRGRVEVLLPSVRRAGGGETQAGREGLHALD